MRGKDSVCNESAPLVGITPAYAGKRAAEIPSSRRTGDHPRVCGEKPMRSISADSTAGSPPRMRGKGVDSCNQRVAVRITPAYAGKSGTGSGPAPGPKDHPRVCGEKLRKTALSVRELGSPPRMRGKGQRRPGRLWQAGITPAYAGKRANASHSAPQAGDHPRVCGEKIVKPQCNDSAMGSPPRMRGKVNSAGMQGSRSGDHPRVCGEKGFYNA